MAIDLQSLFDRAFFAEEVQNASEAIERMLRAFDDKAHISARPFEAVAPEDADDEWVREGLLHRLIYFCESEGAQAPSFRGVVVALFVGSHLYGIPAEQVIGWGSELLGSSIEQLEQQYGTHEVETSVR